MARIKDGYDETENDLIDKIFEETVGFKHIEITHTTTSDREAKGIGMMLNHDEDVCDIHNFNEIEKLDIGDLVRTSSKAHHFSLFVTFKFYFEMIQFLTLSFFTTFIFIKMPINSFQKHRIY